MVHSSGGEKDRPPGRKQVEREINPLARKGGFGPLFKVEMVRFEKDHESKHGCTLNS